MPDLFQEITRPSAAETVAQRIKRLIMDGRLVAEDVLPPERELATRLGVSRSTVREALLALAIDGILAGRQGSGWVVRPNGGTAAAGLAALLRLQDATFDAVDEARLVVEPAIAALAARRRSAGQLAAIEAAFQDMAGIGAPDAFLEADSAFHAAIAAAAGNPLLAFSMLPAMTLLEDVRRAVLAEAGSIAASQEEHAGIVVAIRDGDADAAAAAMRRHIRRFRSRGDHLANEAGR